MTLRQPHIFFVAIFALFIGASQASAQMCATVLDVAPEQRAMGRTLQTATASAIERDLFQILSHATDLSRYNVRNTALRDKISGYLYEVLRVRTDLRLNGPTSAALLTQSDNFEGAVKALDRLATRYCAAETDQTTSGDQSRDDRSENAINMSWKLGLQVSAVIAAVMAGAGYLLNRKLRQRTASRLRYICNVPVTLTAGSKQFPTRMVDISAVGAKVLKLERDTLDLKATLQIEKKKYHGKIMWQNAHFAGINFSRPISASLVRKWSVKPRSRKIA